MTPNTVDTIRKVVNDQLIPKNKAEYGQFMTPSVIAEFMAKLFDKQALNVKLIDCGAGIGSLSISAISHLKNIEQVDLWEIDPIMSKPLEVNMKEMEVFFQIFTEDFISNAVTKLLENDHELYTHAIINPPYKKINSNSKHRLELRKVGIETVNLYSAFLALTIKMMADDGQIVAIIPRSFCNGPYYKSFRELMLKECSIEHIHIFDSRNKAFKEDDVLQENIIIKLVKSKVSNQVCISQSSDHKFNDYKENIFVFEDIVKPNDPEIFIHIPTNTRTFSDEQALFSKTLTELNLNVSTGPVVDFRMKEYLEMEASEDNVPLLYPHHFENRKLIYPRVHKKPNAIRVEPVSQKWLFPNDGYYVLVKRFSAKEERRRIVAYVVAPNEINKKWIGFENHWNVFHVKKHGLSKDIAFGMACFLNSTIVDDYFRVFSGHTQVNATDLKNMKYPSIESLGELSKQYEITIDQNEIDRLVEGLITNG